MTAATKALIEALARSSGRTQSAEAEFLIERCLQYDRTLMAMRVTERELSAAQARFVTFKRGKRTPGDNDAPFDDSVGCQPSRVTS